ncbi:hypothetical protein CRD_00143 [Raphidiopsis brookii D9]|nr:hypothetical protein CRD_00143 [Raphidiopsis brookii D9]
MSKPILEGFDAKLEEKNPVEGGSDAIEQPTFPLIL